MKNILLHIYIKYVCRLSNLDSKSSRIFNLVRDIFFRDKTFLNLTPRFMLFTLTFRVTDRVLIHTTMLYKTVILLDVISISSECKTMINLFQLNYTYTSEYPRPIIGYTCVYLYIRTYVQRCSYFLEFGKN